MKARTGKRSAAKRGGAKRRGADNRGARAARTKRLYLPPPGGFGVLPFASGVLAGDTFYLAGHIGFEPATLKVPADPDQEARLLLDGVRATLAQADLAMDDLVFVQVFCTDISLFERFNAIYRTYFREPLPARAFIGAAALLLGARFELLGVAVKGK